MATKEEIKHQLLNTKFFASEIKELQERLAECAYNAQKVTPSYSFFKGSSSHDTSKVETNVLTLLTLEESIKKRLREYQAIVKSNAALIASVPDPMQQAVLEEHFIYGMTFQDIADKLGYTPRHINNIYAKGLQWLADKENNNNV